MCIRVFKVQGQYERKPLGFHLRRRHMKWSEHEPVERAKGSRGGAAA
jgi:hypothetical protein